MIEDIRNHALRVTLRPDMSVEELRLIQQQLAVMSDNIIQHLERLDVRIPTCTIRAWMSIGRCFSRDTMNLPSLFTCFSGDRNRFYETVSSKEVSRSIEFFVFLICGCFSIHALISDEFNEQLLDSSEVNESDDDRSSVCAS